MLNQNLNDTWKVRDIKMDGLIFRLYNEKTTSSEFALYLETVYKIHKLIEKYNFKLYHLQTTPKTNLILKFNSKKKVDIYDEGVKKIKFLQSNDLYFLYMNIFFEVFYFIPHLNNNNNYSYEMLILVEENFDIKKISNHNFNLINIESCKKINKEKVNFNFIESFFESRSIIGNSTLSSGEYEYDYSGHGLDHDDYIKNYNNGKSDFELQHKTNLSSFKFNQKINQNFYVQLNFKCLSTHIWDFGRVYYIEENKHGRALLYDDLYEDVGLFFTNFGELADLKAVDISETVLKFEDVEYYSCSISENCDQLDIQSCSLSKEFVLNNFIDINNKEVRVKKGDKCTRITYII